MLIFPIFPVRFTAQIFGLVDAIFRKLCLHEETKHIIEIKMAQKDDKEFVLYFCLYIPSQLGAENLKTWSYTEHVAHD